MSGERYVALGLAGVRATWFTEVARWATVGSVPIEFVKCISADELRARLESGRVFSVVLVDAGTGAVDRDLLDVASSRKVPVVVVEDGRIERDWIALGARAVLPATFERGQLLDTLAHTTTMVGGATALPTIDGAADGPSTARRVIAVTGSGGVGASTVAIALAQGIAAGDPTKDVVLADLCLHADLAMLHDARDIVPGIQELVDAHRSGRPEPATVRSLTFTVEARGYHLLLGLRRHRDWTVLRSRSFEAAIDGLERTFSTVVADIDGDVEGEPDTGSVEVEERNLMARTVARRASALVVVGAPGLKGMHALVRLINGLRDFGVSPDRLLAVVNSGPRSPRLRAELTRTFADLTGATAGLPPVAGPIYLPERRTIDDLHRDGARLPGSFAGPAVRAVEAVLHRATAPTAIAAGPVAIVPGSLGSWAEQEAAGQ